MNARTRTVASILALGLLSMAPAGLAGETQWQKDHPRRAEVNGRLKNQNKRTNQGVKNGKLTSQQAGQLHHEDRQIRQEERDMASQNGGHITKQEQKTLNQQENQVSKRSEE